MKPHEKLLGHLARTDVLEMAIATGRLPCVKVGNGFKPVDATALTTDAIYDLLFAAGGSRHVDNLGVKPVNWTFRLEGVGTIAIAAIERDGSVQARFAITKREAPTKTLPSAYSPPEPPAIFPSVRPVPAARIETAGPPGFARTASNEALELDLEAALRAEHRAPTSQAPPHAAGPQPRLSDPFGEAIRMPHSPPLSDPFSDESGGSYPAPKPSNPFTFEGDDEDLDVNTVETRAPDVAPSAALAFALDFDARIHSGGSGAIESDAAAPRADGTAFDGSLDSLFSVARKERASDLHVIAGRPMLLRIAGDLVARGEPLEPHMVETVIMQVIPERVRAGYEKDGSCDFGLDHRKFGRFRANVTRQRTGVKACFRLISEQVPSLESLRLPDSIAAATHHHQGLIVITGPTGHGKTTTLTAIVDLINTNTTHHVITVEDPVEFIHPCKRAMMSQREVGTHTKSFRSALKGSLREDPDVIVIGELRDTETVRIALAASETGHLVIGTMNTPSAAKTIDRIIDLFPPGDQQQVRLTLAGGLKLIVSQRLVPNGDRTAMMAACEVLPGSIALWNLIRDNKTFQIPSLQQRGKALGIVRLDDSLADLVRAGRTTAAMVLPFAEAPDELAAKIAAGGGQARAGGPPNATLHGQPRAPANGAPPPNLPEAPKGGGLFAKATTIFGGKKGG